MVKYRLCAYGRPLGESRQAETFRHPSCDVRFKSTGLKVLILENRPVSGYPTALAASVGLFAIRSAAALPELLQPGDVNRKRAIEHA